MEQIIKQIKNIYSEVDKVIGCIPNVCSKGCSFCCHQNIRISAIEELTISEYLDNHVDDNKKQIIKKQLENWIYYFNQKTEDKKILNEEDIFNFESEIFKDSIPCFFLISGECSIYPLRPLVCRTHIVSEKPEICNFDRKRKSILFTYTVREHALKRLLLSAPNNSLRLLAYAMKDYFQINIPTKPIKLEKNG